MYITAYQLNEYEPEEEQEFETAYSACRFAQHVIEEGGWAVVTGPDEEEIEPFSL